MVQVEMNADIKDFQPKVLSIFTGRQLICIIIACTYGLPFMMMASFIPDIFTRIVTGFVLMAPVLACGWGNAYGMPLEQFMKTAIVGLVLTPRKRKYETKNTYEQEIIKLKRAENSTTQSKGKKQQTKKKKITYGSMKPYK